MANGEKHYGGTDVGKMGLEVAVHGRQRTEAFPNTAEGIGKLVRKLENLQPALIVVEAKEGMSGISFVPSLQLPFPLQ